MVLSQMSGDCSLKACYSEREDLEIGECWFCPSIALLVFWVCICFCTKLLIFLRPSSGKCKSYVPSAAFCIASVLSREFWGKQVTLYSVTMLGDLSLEQYQQVLS